MCKYCQNEFQEIEAEEQDGGCMFIACNAPGLIVEINSIESLTFNINFCPKCGRDLKNEKQSGTNKLISKEFHEFIFESTESGTDEIIKETNQLVADGDIETEIMLNDIIGNNYFYECMRLAENVIISLEKYPNEKFNLEKQGKHY